MNYRFALVLSCFCALLFTQSINAQNNLSPISSLVFSAKHKTQAVETYPFNTKIGFDAEENVVISNKLKSYTLLELNTIAIEGIVENSPEFMTFDLITALENTYQLELIRVNPFSENFKVTSNLSNGQELEIGKGVHYHGIVNGDANSTAAISFFKNEVIGVFSTPSKGNFNLGVIDQEEAHETSYILYAEKDLDAYNPVGCDTDESEYIPEPFSNAISSVAPPCKNVEVYIEADNILYRDKNSSVSDVTNYITGLYNVVTMIYDNEQVNTSIKEIFIWQSSDPYRKDNSANCLADFNNRMNSMGFDGDIAHLFTTSRTNIGGRAYVDILCRQNNRTAISNIGRNFRTLPIYSWSVQVVAHEMGHNLGSPHTHRCAWGPSRNETLDNCATPENGCAPGPAPINGGTIMSYCHLTGNGINFANGFGPEPGDLIRAEIANAGCLGGAFDAIVSVTGEEEFYVGDSAILKATPIGFQYDYQWFRNGSMVNGATTNELIVFDAGSYHCEITTNCTEKSEAVDITVNDFIVSLNCPPDQPVVEYAEITSDTFYIDVDETEQIFNIPASLFASVHPDANRSFVEMDICVGKLGISFLSQANVNITGPPPSNIIDEAFTDHKSFFDPVRCFSKSLGSFDPTGDWIFRLSDIGNNNVRDPESYVVVTIKQGWEFLPLPSGCNKYICKDGMAELDAGFPGLEYKWTTGETTQKITVDQEGTYGVTVTNGTVERSDDIEVIVQKTDYSYNIDICDGESFPLGSLELTATGTYMDELISSIGCDSNVTINLNVKEVKNTSEEVFLCYGDEYNGKSYVRDEVITIEEMAENGCDSTHLINITVNAEMDLSLEATIGCENEGGLIDATPSGGSGTGYTFEWNNGEKTEDLMGAKSGLYQCVLTDDKGCKTTSEIELMNLDSVGAIATIEELACPGDESASIKLQITSGSGTLNFQWSNGKQSKDIKDLNAGQYSVVITDGNNCTFEKTYDIKDPLPVDPNETIANANIGNNGSITLDPMNGTMPYTYMWSTGETTKDIMDLAPGSYSVKITDANDCMVEESFDIINSTSLNGLSDLSSYKVFPNPTQGQLNVHLDFLLNKRVVFEVINHNGVLVTPSQSYFGNSIRKDFDMSHQPSGSYFLKIVSDKEVGIIKFTILK